LLPGMFWIASDGMSAEPEEYIALSQNRQTDYFFWEKQTFPPHLKDLKRFFCTLSKKMQKHGLTVPDSIPFSGDYEPVYCSKSKHVLISRFHYYFAILWTSPKLKEKKPIVKFLSGSHTPIIKSHVYWVNKWILHKRINEMGPVKRAYYLKFYSRFAQCLQDFMLRFQPNDLSSLTNYACEEGGVLPEAKLDFRKTLFCYYIGERQAHEDELPPELAKLLFGSTFPLISNGDSAGDRKDQ